MDEPQFLCDILTNSIREADDDLKGYDLEHYDSDVPAETDTNGSIFANIRSLAYHTNNADDPYITLKDDGGDDEEREELQILPTDNMVVAARVEDEVPFIEVYVYEDEADNLYVHHDMMLPAIPLCIEWLDLPVGKSQESTEARGNFLAVGTFDPDIEIWDLDTVDGMYPSVILGPGGQEQTGTEGKGKKKTKRKKSKKARDDYHVDAVLSLAANRQHRNLMASSSADKTIKLWDLTATVCAKSYAYHTDKICSVAWNSQQSTVLLSGSYDRTAAVADMRSPDASPPRWGVESDVETVLWDPHRSDIFYVTTENGFVHSNDIRKPPRILEATKSIWSLQAHNEAVSSFDVNPHVPGYLVTGSIAKEVKLWNVQPTGPSLIASRNLGIGKVFTTKFAPDAEVSFRLAVGGSKGAMQIWDTSTNPAVRTALASRLPVDEGVSRERMVAIEEDSSDSAEEEGSGGMDAPNGSAGDEDHMHILEDE